MSARHEVAGIPAGVALAIVTLVLSIAVPVLLFIVDPTMPIDTLFVITLGCVVVGSVSLGVLATVHDERARSFDRHARQAMALPNEDRPDLTILWGPLDELQLARARRDGGPR